MKRYGLRIGEIGVEFVSREERQKAIVLFTNGVCCKISETGIRYTDDKGAFGTYERDDKEVIVNCSACHGVFGMETCPDREHPYLDWQKIWKTSTGYICDACFAEKNRQKQLADATALLAANAGA